MINSKGNEKKGGWVSLHNRGIRKLSIKNWKLIDGKDQLAIMKGSIKSEKSIKLKGAKKGKIQLSISSGSLMLLDHMIV